jgi:hypothetical protein
LIGIEAGHSLHGAAQPVELIRFSRLLVSCMLMKQQALQDTRRSHGRVR